MIIEWFEEVRIATFFIFLYEISPEIKCEYIPCEIWNISIISIR